MLVVAHITKNLLSISKLKNDSPMDILFSDSFFSIQNRATKEPLAKGKRENGLYVLEHASKAATLKSRRLKASFELWNN